MNTKYASPEEIPDQVIREEFAKADLVKFSARPYNHIQYRSISFGDLGWWLPLKRVLPLLGITPQMLRSVFNPQIDRETRREIELPEEIESYEQLGYFPLDRGAFIKLAQVLAKPIEVMRENGSTGDHQSVFTAYPTGEIILAKPEGRISQ